MANSTSDNTRLSAIVLWGALIALVAAATAVGWPAERYTKAELVQFLTGAGGMVWFADEQTYDGGYSRTVHSTRRRPPDPPVESRTIHHIDFWGDSAPRGVWLAVSRCPDLRRIDVTPPVYRSAAFKPVRDRLAPAQIHVEWAPRHAPVQVVTSAAQYDGATATRRFVLFLGARNAIGSSLSISRYCELACVVSRQRSDVVFIYLDFSDELMTPFWHRMNEWFAAQDVPELGYRGYGKTLWVADGRVVHWDQRIGDRDLASLIEKTHAVLTPVRNSNTGR